MVTATRIGTVLALLFGLAALATAVSALTIVSPAPGQYESPVTVNISANATQDTLSYTIMPGNASETCTNCTALTASEQLDAGNYTLSAQATLGNETEQENVSFEVLPPLPAFNISIVEPTDGQSFNTSDVPLNITMTTTVDALEYQVDNGSFQQACTNCSGFATMLNESDGNHTFTARGTFGNETESAAADFTVQQPAQPAALTLAVASPLAQAYMSPVQLSFLTNLPATISYTLDNTTVQACTNCTGYATSQALGEGDHTLAVFAAAQNQSVNATVVFSVVNATNQENGTENETNETGNESGQPRFSLGFEHLPQLVASGNITDDELAAIIRANRLNPGILNRLIKTGKLGNESIDAIIATQSAPPGIFQRILGFFGFRFATPKDQLAEQYNLTDDQEAQLLTQNDISPSVSAKLKHGLQARAQERTAHGPSAAPGLMKKEDGQGNAASASGRGNGGTPPGLARHYDVGGQQGAQEVARGNNGGGNDNEGNGKSNGHGGG